MICHMKLDGAGGDSKHVFTLGLVWSIENVHAYTLQGVV